MTSNSDDLLAKAAACEEHAKHVRDPQVRALFLGLARQWRDLAKLLREGERPDLSRAESRLTRRSG
jgi:rubrerythrin